ncbi:leukocyte surface antigen CD53-like [Sitodiplosis mosellana]|uniref:leukocyte surface antigen CD53-like n=1 Tax=Sitodiplosis mosellana TaxID=263140 RepID=UPI002443C8AF|nr:leukocyte surface antigen CD53-like [Sitodiplosis mosellana]
MVDIGLSFAKYIVFIFNFLFALVGLCMGAVGVIIKTKLVHFEAFTNQVLSAFPVVLIVFGCVIFLIAFLGCCGSVSENTCCLFGFSVILIMIILFEVGISIFAYEKKDQLDSFVENSLRDTLRNIKDDSTLYPPWHLLQYEFNCCGINSPDDWKAVNDTIYLPPSCCHLNIDDQTTCLKDQASKLGCKKALIDFLHDHIVYLVGIGAGIIVFQLFGVVFSCCLFSVFRKN